MSCHSARAVLCTVVVVVGGCNSWWASFTSNLPGLLGLVLFGLARLASGVLAWDVHGDSC